MVVCIVTVHGIGFEQPPDDPTDLPGYADQLHAHLHAYFADRYPTAAVLGDDPNRPRSTPGEHGPVYVQSLWQASDADHPSRERGLSRLGTWVAENRIDHADPKTALVVGNAAVAHVALVYSNLERPYVQDPGPHVGATMETAAKAAVSLGHYASVAGLVRMLFDDARALLHHAPPGEPPSSLHPRTDLPHRPAHPHLFPRAQAGGGFLDSVRALEDDVATYVCRNELRERVRSFVREALLRLCCRDDVSAIIVNAHSQGTVVAYDVVRELPRGAAERIAGIVTAGSPLRKYVDFFAWGTEAGSVSRIGPWAALPADRTPGPWVNFYDDDDPVADPLAPDWQWHRGTDADPYPDRRGLFVRNDPETGDTYRLPVMDVMVDNVNKSAGGGLRAHNYWDNVSEVIGPLGEFVRGIAIEATQTAGALRP